MTISVLIISRDLAKKEIEEVTTKIPRLISEHYVLKEKRSSITSGINKMIKSKKYLTITNPDSLAKTLTRDLREIDKDKHLYVKFLKARR